MKAKVWVVGRDMTWIEQGQQYQRQPKKDDKWVPSEEEENIYSSRCSRREIPIEWLGCRKNAAALANGLPWIFRIGKLRGSPARRDPSKTFWYPSLLQAKLIVPHGTCRCSQN